MQCGEAYWHSYAFPHIHYERVWMSECQALRLMLEIQWWGEEIVQAGLLSLSPSGGDGHYGDNRTGKWESMTGARDERTKRETDCAQGWQNNSGMPHLTCQLDPAQMFKHYSCILFWVFLVEIESVGWIRWGSFPSVGGHHPSPTARTEQNGGGNENLPPASGLQAGALLSACLQTQPGATPSALLALQLPRCRSWDFS